MPTVIRYPLPLNRSSVLCDAVAILPHGNRAADEVFSLPMHPYLTEEAQDRIAAVLAQVEA